MVRCPSRRSRRSSSPRRSSPSAFRSDPRSASRRSSTSRTSGGRGWPAHPHSTVRSLSSSLNVSPWSTPRTRPSAPRRMCPPLRSALFATASSTDIRRREGSSACTSATRSPSQPIASTTCSHPSGRRPGATTSTRPAPGSASGRPDSSSSGSWVGSPWIHHCTLPGPKGPSARSVVGGTTSHPVAADSRYVAASRLARVRLGKSHSGRSPAVGLYTHSASTPSRLTWASRVALLASTSRPRTSSSPRASTSRASASSSCQAAPVAGGSEATRSSSLPAVAVGAGADVTGCVQRAVAEGAGRPSRGHYGERPLREGTRRGAGHADAQDGALELLRVRLVLLVLVDGDAFGEALHHHAAGVRVPGEAHRAHPELLLDGDVEGVVVLGVDGRDRRDGSGAAADPQHLVEQLLDPLGEDGHLGLLQRDARHLGAAAGLEEERARA